MLRFFVEKMREAREDARGFTLIELLVVVIIIGILAAIAIPVYLNQRAGAQDVAAQAQLRSAATAQASFAAQNNNFTNDPAALTPFGFPNSGSPSVEIRTPGGAVPSTGSAFCMRATGAGTNVFVVRDTATSPQLVGSTPSGGGAVVTNCP